MRPLHPTPSEKRVRVGARLRASRRAQGLTIAQLADATRLTKGFISRVERDETSPSVATLLTICEVLSLPIGTLFEASETELVQLKQAPLINMGGRGAVERMITPRGQSKIQMLRSTLQPDADGGDKLYTVNCDVEVVHVISGSFEIQFTDRTVALVAGDTITFPGRELHNWKSTGTVEAEVLWTLVPAAWSGAV
ncbi:transcriptional regulator with XRE-family HTH domain [Cryobacterium sp. CAN_C3]|uniref:helix-turn-helix domain-containing protein n=1 Tax=unclassified Cryobacterium TaxID=2649013 RepID=UPI0018CBA2F4|nr:helix-turn-helix domain-containing protein [Cryobacterium sp. CAN_C3]MEC5155390.1 transcriptional regulator with XRE-family HTH domain [Cryobacterium sp. CAN_C3]